MTISQNAQNAVSRLTASVDYAELLPIRKALDRLQQLEREQEAALNREVIARELFIQNGHGQLARDDMRRTWDEYLRIEAAGFPQGQPDPSSVLRRYREDASSLVGVLHGVNVYN